MAGASYDVRYMTQDSEKINKNWNAISEALPELIDAVLAESESNPEFKSAVVSLYDVVAAWQQFEENFWDVTVPEERR